MMLSMRIMMMRNSKTIGNDEMEEEINLAIAGEGGAGKKPAGVGGGGNDSPDQHHDDHDQ